MSSGMTLGMTITANVGNAQNAFRSLTGQVNGLQNAARQAGAQLNQVGSGTGGFHPGSFKSAVGTPSRMSASGGGMGLGAMGAGLGAMAPMLGAGALAAGFGEAASEGAKLSTALAQLRVVGGLSAEELARARQAAIDLGLSGKFGPDQVVDALNKLASAGLSASESMDVLGGTLNLALGSAGKLGTAESAALVAQVIKGFGVSSKEATGYLDKLAKTANVFGAELGDMPQLISNASRGGAMFSKSIDDTMISLGLIRNMMPRIESAGTAVGMAMEAMARKDVQQSLKGIGVAVVDTAGNFRPFLDIVQDMMGPMQKMTEAQRQTWLQATFGADATQGLIHMLSQLGQGMKDSNGQVVKGAEAVAFLRSQMQNSTGELQRFADASSEGYGGALDRLSATWTTLKQVVGGTVGGVLAPALDRVQKGISAAVRWWDRLGESTKQALSTAAFAAAGVAAALFTLGAPGLAVVAAVIAIRKAYEANLGGIADKIQAVGQKISLLGRALFEVFSSGGFSRGLYRELDTAENQGLKRFVLKVYAFAQLVSHFLTSIGEGIQAGIKAAQPTIDRLSQAFDYLAVTLGLTSHNTNEARASWDKWGKVGEVIGKALVFSLEMGAKVLARITEAAGGFMTKWPAIKQAIQPAIDAVHQIGASIGSVLTQMGLMSPSADTTSNWQKVGRFIGQVVVEIASAISRVAQVISFVVSVFSGAIKFIHAMLTGDWGAAWNAAYGVIATVFKAIVGVVTTGIQGITKPIDKLIEGLLAVGSKLGIDVSALSGISLTKGAQGISDDITAQIDAFKPKVEDKAAAVGATAADTAALWAAQQQPTIDAFSTSLKNLKADVKTTTNIPISIMLDGELIAQHLKTDDGRETTATVPND
jgi:TP901 family phage tail tape measure protein